MGDSNPRPIDCEPIALPTELIPRRYGGTIHYFQPRIKIPGRKNAVKPDGSPKDSVLRQPRGPPRLSLRSRRSGHESATADPGKLSPASARTRLHTCPPRLEPDFARARGRARDRDRDRDRAHYRRPGQASVLARPSPYESDFARGRHRAGPPPPGPRARPRAYRADPRLDSAPDTPDTCPSVLGTSLRRPIASRSVSSAGCAERNPA